MNDREEERNDRRKSLRSCRDGNGGIFRVSEAALFRVTRRRRRRRKLQGHGGSGQKGKVGLGLRLGQGPIQFSVWLSAKA